MSSYQATDIYVVENTPDRRPVEGVMVRIYDETNRYFHTQDSTDETGRAGFTLFTATYNLRFFKEGVQVRQPQIIEVLEPAPGEVLINAFDALATVFRHPIATDPRLCRASGFFRDVTGAPDPFVDMFVLARFSPILLEGAGVLSERRAIRTDEEGFACVDLIRFARYSVIIQGHEDQERLIDVPDQPSVNLPDLLFPVVDRVSFIPEVSTMLLGETLVLTPAVLGSNDVPLTGTAQVDVSWSSSDNSVLSVAVGSETLTLLAKKRGTAQLQASRINTSIVRIPNTPILGVPVTVTVT